MSPVRILEAAGPISAIPTPCPRALPCSRGDMKTGMDYNLLRGSSKFGFYRKQHFCSRRLAGLFRAHLTNNDSGSSRNSPVPAHSGSQVTSSSSNPSVVNGGAAAASSSSSNQTPNSSQQRPDSIQQHAAAAAALKDNNSDYDPVDYRCYNNQSTKSEPQSEVRTRVRRTSQCSLKNNNVEIRP